MDNIVLSLLALTISLATAWFTIFHRGSIKMTQPSFVALVKGDGPAHEAPKLFLRTLLYTTGKRGQALEHMFVRVRQRKTSQTLPFWSNGQTGQLNIGSGLFIGPEGHAANHHFVVADASAEFRLTPGTFCVAVYGVVARSTEPTLLSEFELELSEDQLNAFNDDPHASIFFTWHPDDARYSSRVETRPLKARSHSVSGSGHGRFFFE